MKRKYTPENLIPVLRHFVAARRYALDIGFTDNGGAIHSVERISNILGLRLNYPGLGHQNNLRNYQGAKFSKAASQAHNKGLKVEIEHVAPVRAWSRSICEQIENGCTDDELKAYVKDTFVLVLLTPEERQQLDRDNRSRMCPSRLSGIEMDE